MFGLWISFIVHEKCSINHCFASMISETSKALFQPRKTDLLELSHLYACSARDEIGPSPVMARRSIVNSWRPTAWI